MGSIKWIDIIVIVVAHYWWAFVLVGFLIWAVYTGRLSA